MERDVQAQTEDAWMRHMREGDFAAAWKISDAVLRSRAGAACWHLPRHHQYIWNGTPLTDKRVLVRCYHGLGDTIQFIRYMPLVKAIAAKVIVWAQGQLIPLLKTAQGIDQLLPLHDGTPEVAYDVDVEIMELPHLFRSTLATLPTVVPYLHVPSMDLPRNNRRAVGLVWRAGEWDERRSIPFALLRAALEGVPNVTWYILQRGLGLTELTEGFGIVPDSADIFTAARVISALDLVISVDTMTAHLAGALGVNVWTLLQHDADWRWMTKRDDCPWYPTMRLFRQERSGDWQPVIERVAMELHRSLEQANGNNRMKAAELVRSQP